jgi:hypothetical protein
MPLEVPTLMLNGTEDFAPSAGDLGGYEPTQTTCASNS